MAIELKCDEDEKNCLKKGVSDLILDCMEYNFMCLKCGLRRPFYTHLNSFQRQYIASVQVGSCDACQSIKLVVVHEAIQVDGDCGVSPRFDLHFLVYPDEVVVKPLDLRAKKRGKYLCR